VAITVVKVRLTNLPGVEGMNNVEKVARSFRYMDDVEPASKIRLRCRICIVLPIIFQSQ
jgi:hypothetical protein